MSGVSNTSRASRVPQFEKLTYDELILQQKTIGDGIDWLTFKLRDGVITKADFVLGVLILRQTLLFGKPADQVTVKQQMAGVPHLNAGMSAGEMTVHRSRRRLREAGFYAQVSVPGSKRGDSLNPDFARFAAEVRERRRDDQWFHKQNSKPKNPPEETSETITPRGTNFVTPRVVSKMTPQQNPSGFDHHQNPLGKEKPSSSSSGFKENLKLPLPPTPLSTQEPAAIQFHERVNGDENPNYASPQDRLKAIFQQHAGQSPLESMIEQVQRKLAGLPDGAFERWLDDVEPRVTKCKRSLSEGFYVDDAEKFARAELTKQSPIASDVITWPACIKCNPNGANSDPGIVYTPDPDIGGEKVARWCTCAAADELRTKKGDDYPDRKNASVRELWSQLQILRKVPASAAGVASAKASSQ